MCESGTLKSACSANSLLANMQVWSTLEHLPGARLVLLASKSLAPAIGLLPAASLETRSVPRSKAALPACPVAEYEVLAEV